MSNYQNPSQTSQGKHEEFYLQLARGHIPNHEPVHKFGAVPSMSINTGGTVWDVSDNVYPWAAMAVATTLEVVSDPADNGMKVTLIGLDDDFLEIEDAVILANSVTSTKEFRRIFRAYVTNGEDTNTADIDIKAGANTVALISSGFAQTLMAVYTIPANKTGYVVTIEGTAEATADGTCNFYAKEFVQSTFRIQHSFEIGDAPYIRNFKVPLKIDPKTDLDMRVETRSNNGRFTSAFDIVLIDN